jgi:cystathionine gamma-synthase
LPEYEYSGDAFATRAVHAGLENDPAYGAVAPAIYQSATFIQKRPGEYTAGYDYSRTANPTRDAAEAAVGSLEEGHAVTFASGLAAEHALITAVCSAGSHVVLPKHLYGGTHRLVDKVLAQWGVTYTLVDQGDLDALERAIRPKTALIWVESPTNPMLDVVDIEAIVARRGNAKVVVDNTFATPVNQLPLNLGVDFVVHSTTKYLAGHSDVIGGAVVTRDEELDKKIRFVQNAAGAIPGPFDCFLLQRGIRTLPLRMKQHARNAQAVSDYLRTASGVSEVRWPGFSGMVAFRHPKANELASRTRLFALAESLGAVESLIEVPHSMTHQATTGTDAAIPSDFVRLSCGIEDPVDLVADLRQAIESI